MKLRWGVILLPLVLAALALLMGAGCSIDEPDVRPEPPGDVPVFTYESYCDGQGRFTYDGAALKLVRRPAHLERVYADARRGDARATELVRELEEWFARAGVVVADTTTRPACLPLPELTPECQPNWQFLTTLLGTTREAERLREVVAHAYAVRARERGLTNRVIVEGTTLLMAGGLMTKAAAAEVRAATPAIEASSVDGLAAGGEAGHPTLRPGPHADDSIPARSSSQRFTPAERAEIDRIGQTSGCHTCGAKDPNTKSGHFVPDHQPPSAIVPEGTPQRLSPQCINCSREQGLELARQKRGQ